MTFSLEIIAHCHTLTPINKHLQPHETLATESNHFTVWANHDLAPQCLFAGHRGPGVSHTAVSDILMGMLPYLFGWQWDCWGKVHTRCPNGECIAGSHSHQTSQTALVQN